MRVEKAPRDVYGKPVSYDGKSFEEAAKGGVVSVAPKYHTGKYNNSLHQIDKDEEMIFQYKIKWRDSPLKVVMGFLKDAFKRDKVETLDETIDWA